MTRLVVCDFTDASKRVAFNLYKKAGVNFNDLLVLPPGQYDPMLNTMNRIDALGEEALQALTGLKGIDKWRGSPLPLIGESIPRVMPTFDPADMMGMQLMIPTVVSDLKKSLIVPPEYYNLAPTIEDLRNFRAKRFALDIETGWPKHDEITFVGLSDRLYHAMCIPFTDSVRVELKRICENADEIITHNGLQFDCPRLFAALGITCKAEMFDTMLAQHLIQPDAAHDLEFVSSVFTNKPAWKSSRGSNEALYNCRDVDVTFQIAEQLQPLLKMLKLEDLYKYTQVPLAKICRLMHTTGIRTEPSRVEKVRDRVLAEMADWELKLPEKLRSYDKTHSEKTGKPVKPKHIVPWRSPVVVKDYLYSELQLKPKKNSKTGRTTVDKKALASLFRATNNPAIGAIRELNARDELVSNFLSVKNTTATTIHPNFNVHGTNSGRLSSSGPNMQNQPPASRFIYVPLEKDWVFVEADFSQGENRLVAYYAGDNERITRLAQPGFSEHKWNAATFFSMKYEDVVKDNDRSAPYGMAKILTHGMGYGMGPRKIATDNELEEKFVKNLIAKWKEANSLTVRWQEVTTKQAESDGVLTNAFGRKRWFWTDRTYTESLAFIPQSSLADISYRAMIGLMYERIGWPSEIAARVSVLSPLPSPAVLHLQVHDSLLVSCPKEIMGEVINAMRKAMEQPHKELGGYSIPVEFSVGQPGDSWAELAPYV